MSFLNFLSIQMFVAVSEWHLPRWSNPGFHLAVLQDCVVQISYPKTLDGDKSQLWSYSEHYPFPPYMLCDVWSEDNRLFPNFPFPLILYNSTHLPRASPSPVASGARNSSIAEHSHIHTGLGILFIFLLLCHHKSHISDPYKINVTEKSTPDQDRLPFSFFANSDSKTLFQNRANPM